MTDRVDQEARMFSAGVEAGVEHRQGCADGRRRQRGEKIVELLGGQSSWVGAVDDAPQLDEGKYLSKFDRRVNETHASNEADQAGPHHQFDVRC